ncbi:probable cytochrome P450 4ac1 [Bradysia coprophila]|uniref:probable cytochrome P450 4ac1 n=1 Tax=Bradysia coprophila TaxID=38358 RepID=UPI00187D9E91|nr:probable cytochrome P450 4ac1 [Bradysia coprophila]
MVTTFIPTFNEKSRVIINYVDQFIDRPIDLHKLLFKKTVDEILTTQFGLSWPYQSQRADEIKTLVDGYYECLLYRVSHIYLKWDFLYRLTDFYKRQMKVQTKFFQFISGTREYKNTEFQGKLTEDENELYERISTNKLNYLEKCLWLEGEKQLTRENVLDELVTILVGGSNTSADTLLLILLMLATHQDCQDRVEAELHELFESADDCVTPEHIANLKYLEVVIKETVRLFPILPVKYISTFFARNFFSIIISTFPVMGRETDAEVAIRGGTMPKGAMLMINVLNIQRSPKYWGENAHLFYPERFLPENYGNVHPYAFIGFSAGPRNCIGAKYAWYSMKIFLSSFLRRFKVTTDLEYKDLKIKSGMLLNVVNKNSVRIVRRKW